MRLTAAGFTLLAYGTLCSIIDSFTGRPASRRTFRGPGTTRRSRRSRIRSIRIVCATTMCRLDNLAGRQTFASRGHQYGLTLPDPDRRALIAFLKTL